jgi:mono/diheme cytochrome c family protein
VKQRILKKLWRAMTMNFTYAALLCLGASLVLMLFGPPAVEAAGDPAKGKAAYDKYCMACHGPQGKGDGPAGKMLKPPAADFTSADSKKKSEEDLRQVVENGKPGTAMGPWKSQLSDADIKDVLAYLITLRK